MTQRTRSPILSLLSTIIPHVNIVTYTYAENFIRNVGIFEKRSKDPKPQLYIYIYSYVRTRTYVNKHHDDKTPREVHLLITDPLTRDRFNSQIRYVDVKCRERPRSASVPSHYAMRVGYPEMATLPPSNGNATNLNSRLPRSADFYETFITLCNANTRSRKPLKRGRKDKNGFVCPEMLQYFYMESRPRPLSKQPVAFSLRSRGEKKTFPPAIENRPYLNVELSNEHFHKYVSRAAAFSAFALGVRKPFFFLLLFFAIYLSIPFSNYLSFLSFILSGIYIALNAQLLPTT